MTRKKRETNPYKDYLNIDEVIGSCFDPTPFIQDLNTLTKKQLIEFKNHIEWELNQSYMENLDYYEWGPISYVHDHIKI